MSETYAYPPEVAATLRQQWPSHGVPLPAPAVLTSFIAGGYQASLLREEDRPVQCSLFLLSGAPSNQHDSPPPEVAAAFQVLAFSEPRAYNAQELRRLSPTTQRPGTLLAVAAAPTGELTIQGLVFATRPWDRADAPHQTSLLPPTLFMQVAGPARLAFFCGPQPVLVLQQGQVGDHGGHEFPVGWLSGFVETPAGAAASYSGGAGDALARQLGSYCLRLCLTRVRAQGHGGMMVLVPGADASRLVGSAGLLRPKYGVQHNELGARYRALLARLLARSAALGYTDWVTYRQATDGELLQLRTELEQFADLLADLMAVDGALVLDKQFSVLGFGVEIAAPAPATPLVYRALDAEGSQQQAEAADSGGTRHRAAYRLCQAEVGCQAIVVSQDGGIRLVRQRAGQVVFWNQLILSTRLGVACRRLGRQECLVGTINSVRTFTHMNLGALTTAGRRRNPLLLLPLLSALLLAGCRTCPIDTCHIRKAHYHNGVKYRARPIWKMQFPAIGEKQKLNREHKEKRRESDHSRPLR